MNLIIAGSRAFSDYAFLEKKLDHLLSRTELSTVTVFSGCCRGADRLGERYAKTRGIAIRRFPAEWEDINVEGAVVKYRIPNDLQTAYNAKAGNDRNLLMAQEAVKADAALVLFWDGVSSGSKNMLDLANQMKIRVRVVNFAQQKDVLSKAA